jgi:hypothetical protein
MLRSVSKYQEFTQVDGATPYRDWLFVKRDSLVDAEYRISATFPQNDNIGFSRYKVPVVVDVHKITVVGDACLMIIDETFSGIMYGDVNGSYASSPDNPDLKSTASATVLFDMARAIRSESSIEVPVYLSDVKDVTSVDFELQFNEQNLSFASIVKNINGFESADYFNTDDRTLRFTSYSLNATDPTSKFATIRFNTSAGTVSGADLKAVSALINGITARVVVNDGEINEIAVDVYPNPARDVLNIAVSANAKVVLMDMSGRTVLLKDDVMANQKHELNVSGVTSGMYMLKVYNDEFVTMKKVVIKK